MVESPMYERLMQLVAAIEAASALDASDHEHNTVVCGLNEANNSTYHMRTNQAFIGETGDQIDAWTDRAMKQVQAIKDGHNTAMEFYAEARRVMKHVREDAMQLSPTLVDSKLQALADAAHVVIPVTKYMGVVGLPINAVATTGEAYVQGLIMQANNQREAAATDILQRANDTMQALADGTNAQRDAMKQQVENLGEYGGQNPGPSSGSVRQDIERGYLNTSAHEAGVYPGSRDTDYGRSDLRGSGSGLYPAGYDEGGPVSDRVMSSPRIPNRFVTEGEEGRQASAECLRCARGRTPVRVTGPTRRPLAPEAYLVSSELMAPAGRVPVLVPLDPGKPERREPLASWVAVLVRAPVVVRATRRRSVASTRHSAWRMTMSCRRVM